MDCGWHIPNFLETSLHWRRPQAIRKWCESNNWSTLRGINKLDLISSHHDYSSCSSSVYRFILFIYIYINSSNGTRTSQTSLNLSSTPDCWRLCIALNPWSSLSFAGCIAKSLPNPAHNPVGIPTGANSAGHATKHHGKSKCQPANVSEKGGHSNLWNSWDKNMFLYLKFGCRNPWNILDIGDRWTLVCTSWCFLDIGCFAKYTLPQSVIWQAEIPLEIPVVIHPKMGFLRVMCGLVYILWKWIDD